MTAALHQIEDIVTPGCLNRVWRMRVPGGWEYVVEPAGGFFVNGFAPDRADAGGIPLHTVEDVVTPGALGRTFRIRVAAAWFYVIEPIGGYFIADVIPD